MSKLSKFLRSDGGKLLTTAAVAYAKKQSSDVRKAGPIVDILVGAATQEKSDPLAGTIYAQKNTEVNTMAEQPQITPVKSGTQTSTFKAATAASILSVLLPFLLKLAENWVGTLPENSWVAFVMPGILAAVYGFQRYLTTNGERQATATAIAAQAVIAQTQAQTVTQVAAPQTTVETVEDDYESVPG